MRPSHTFQVVEDLRNCFAGPLYRDGVELSSNDGQTVLDVYQQWILLLTDLGYLHHDTLSKTAQRLLTDMVKADVLHLNSAFAELLDSVRNQEIRGFKALCGRISTHLYHLIKDDVQSLPEGNVYAARRLVQLFSYTSRRTLHEIDLTQQCLDDYMKIEQSIPDYYPKYILFALNNIIKGWMKSFDPSRLKPRHGPGGVAGHGRTTLEVKYKDITTDRLLDQVFSASLFVESPIPSTLDRISQTIFVPKSYKTFRTISMESTTLQYFQQSVWKEIDRVVGNSRYLVARVGFHDQERNQHLSKIGSADRNYATIDLSAASDSVSHLLVQELFKDTELLPFIEATRSSRTLLPDGRLIDLKKFAPMGSALCFPIETIIFASVCRLVTHEHGLTSDFSVFGDDIIVPTQCAEDVMLVLEELGFRVNREKSFYRPDCWFRESCGTEYCDGFDVTPMRISRKYNHKQRDIQTTGLIDLANVAYSKGFRNLRQFFIRKLRQARVNPLFAPTVLKSDNYTNYHTQRRWNQNLQRIEAKASALVTKTAENQDESIRYRHWLETCDDRKSIVGSFEFRGHKVFMSEGFQANIGRSTVLLKERWMEKPYEIQDQDFINFFTTERDI
jgi:hypothetical protein